MSDDAKWKMIIKILILLHFHQELSLKLIIKIAHRQQIKFKSHLISLLYEDRFGELDIVYFFSFY
jgi:hypothetical protein